MGSGMTEGIRSLLVFGIIAVLAVCYRNELWRRNELKRRFSVGRVVQFPTLERVRVVFWWMSASSMVAILVMMYLMQGNPKRLTPEFPITLRINGVMSYISASQAHIIGIAFLAFFLCGGGYLSVTYYIKDRSGIWP
jgi:hypothetical protein